MTPPWSLVIAALPMSPGQDFGFPTTAAHAAYVYPTAYYDADTSSGMQDWYCGSDTYNGHRGNDFGVGGFSGMDAGRDVTAAADGVVTYVHDGEFDRCTSGSCGTSNQVKIEHADGRTTTYLHLRKWSITVAVGDVVQCGDVIGQAGSSGDSTGPHLHLGAYDASGAVFDPFAGACSSASTAWVGQGSYGGLPDLTCDGYRQTVAFTDDVTLTLGQSLVLGFEKKAGNTYTICVNPSSGNADLYTHWKGWASSSAYQYKSTLTTGEDCVVMSASKDGDYSAAVEAVSRTTTFTYSVEESAPLGYVAGQTLLFTDTYALATGRYLGLGFEKVKGSTYEVCVTPVSGNPDLYTDYRGFPTRLAYQYRSVNVVGDDCATISATSTGDYFWAVHARTAATFTVSVVEL